MIRPGFADLIPIPCVGSDSSSREFLSGARIGMPLAQQRMALSVSLGQFVRQFASVDGQIETQGSTKWQDGVRQCLPMAGVPFFLEKKDEYLDDEQTISCMDHPGFGRIVTNRSRREMAFR